MEAFNAQHFESHEYVGKYKRTTALIGSVVALSVLSGLAQTAEDIKGSTPRVAIQNETPAKLIADPPIPEQLALGRVFIQYRTENLRILPVFGKAALELLPRIGHLHYYLDVNPGQPSTQAEKQRCLWDCGQDRTEFARTGGTHPSANP